MLVLFPVFDQPNGVFKYTVVLTVLKTKAILYIIILMKVVILITNKPINTESDQKITGLD